MKGGLFQKYLNCPDMLAQAPDLNLIEVLRSKVASEITLVSPTDFQCKFCNEVIAVDSGLEPLIIWASENLPDRLDVCLELLTDDFSLIIEFMASASLSGRLALLKRKRNLEVENFFITKDKYQLSNKKCLLQDEVERAGNQAKKVCVYSFLKKYEFSRLFCPIFCCILKILKILIEFFGKTLV